MKLILPLVLLTLLGCNTKKEPMSMPGAYNMISQSIFDGSKDTTYTTLKEFKIYTEGYMMYVNFNPKDSVSRFGIGSYTADSGKVVENVIYGASDTSSSTNPNSYNLMIEKTSKGYKQVIPSIVSGGITYRLTEDYESVGTSAKSPLDGAWKQTRSYIIKGNDTIPNSVTQYKAYFAGYFMFGHHFADSAGRQHTGIGYGTFEMTAPLKVKEHVTTSAYYQARDKTFNLDIEMIGTDAYKQTITNDDGSKSVEEYERLKKQ